MEQVLNMASEKLESHMNFENTYVERVKQLGIYLGAINAT